MNLVKEHKGVKIFVSIQGEFYCDGTDTSNYSRKSLYPKVIDEKQEFKDLEVLFEQLKENQKKFNKLYDVQIPNRITKVKMDLEGNCYDELDNYLGKGILENGMLKITQDVRANYL